MKRILLIIATLALLVACTPAPTQSEATPPDDDFRVTYIASALSSPSDEILLVNEVEGSRTSITFTLENSSNLEFNYGAPWDLAYYSNDGWRPVPHLPTDGYWAWPGIGFSLQSGGVQRYHQSFERLFGELAPGRYMFIRDGWLGEWHNQNFAYVLVEFLISTDSPAYLPHPSRVEQQTQSTLEPEPEESPTRPPNPFVVPLLEYMSGGMTEGYIEPSRAFWADITGSGNPGVAAIRSQPHGEQTRYVYGVPQPHYPFGQARLFYLADERLTYFDVPDFREAFIVTSPQNELRRVAILRTYGVRVDDVNQRAWSFTFLGIDSSSQPTPSLTYTQTIYIEEAGIHPTNFYSFPGEFDQGLEGRRLAISEEEALAILSEHGFDGPGWMGWALMEDETGEILTMALE